MENHRVPAPGDAGDLPPFFSATYGEPAGWQLSLRACSACAGDYEDPDRTAWPLETETDGEWPPDEALYGPPRTAAEESDFPAEEA